MSQRLDQYLVQKHMVTGRDRAKEVIKNAQVYLNGEVVLKPSKLVQLNDVVLVKTELLRYVSRGGLKLEKALVLFNIPLCNKICMDIGASTGGFTDCMLQAGAHKVYAVDVGTDQLAESLRRNSKVISLEKTNIRYLKQEQIYDMIDFVSIDVSFISLEHILPVVWELLKPDGDVVCLVKPQFEAGAKHLNKKGVVTSKAAHTQVLKKLIIFAQELGFTAQHITYSPITGPKGNIEYLLHLTRQEFFQPSLDYTDVIETAFQEF